MQNPCLTIVIPAYNEEKRLPPTLAKVAAFLRRQSYISEVLVVENGSTDNTSTVVTTFIAEHVRPDDPFQIHLLHSEKGKGRAVKHGVLAGRGEYLLVSDTDLAVPIDEVTQFLPPVLDKHDYAIAIASREIKGAVRHGNPSTVTSWVECSTYWCVCLLCPLSMIRSADSSVLAGRPRNSFFLCSVWMVGGLTWSCCLLPKATA